MKQVDVMLIEDDPDLLEGMQLTLECAGFSVAAFTDGLTAVEQAENLSPACVILDIILPHWDGYEVYRSLRMKINTAAVPVVVLTSLLQLEGHPAADLLRKEKGIAAFFEKPIDPELLVETVRGMIQKQ
ncbi:response regulator [bacterium]|nr:response regulator [bacterium]